MKGLILKDLYGMRFMLVMAMLITLIPYTILMLMGGGMSVDGSDTLKVISVFPYGLINYCCITVFSGIILNTISADRGCGFDKIQRTMPVSAGQIIRGKFIAFGIMLAILTAVSLLFNLMGIFFQINAEVMITMPVCIALLQVCCMSPIIPLSIKIGEGLANVIGILSALLSGGIIVVVALLSVLADNSLLFIRLAAYAGLPILAFISAFFSIRWGERLYKEDL